MPLTKMSFLDCFDSKADARRKLVRFTSFTRFHHPRLDPEFPLEDINLVPRDLCPRGGLSWELPHSSTQKNEGEQDLLQDKDKFVQDLQARISNVQRNVMDLEDFVLDRAEKPDMSLNNQNGRQCEDQLTESTTAVDHRSVSPTTPCSEGSRPGEEVRPSIEIPLPLSRTMSKTHVDNITSCDPEGIPPSHDLIEIQPSARTLGRTRRTRSFGPYESFWYVSELSFSTFVLRSESQDTSCEHLPSLRTTDSRITI